MVLQMASLDKQFNVPHARRLYRSLLDAINDVVIIFDAGSSRVIAANSSASKIYGYTKREFIGKELRTLTAESTDHSSALRSGRVFERTDINKQGEKIEFLVSLSLIDYWGRRAILSINRDIGERKRIEAAIAASEKRARLLIQGISEIVALLDASGVVRFISPQVQRVLGLEVSAVTGQNVFEFLHPDDRNRAQTEFAKTVSEPGEAVPSFVRLKNYEGHWIPFEIIASNQLMDPDVNGVIFTARDLRFRREAEQAVRRANADSERQVEQRTIDLAKANAALRIENQERRYAQTQLEHSLSLLNATLESTMDGILVIANDGRVITNFLICGTFPALLLWGCETMICLLRWRRNWKSRKNFLVTWKTCRRNRIRSVSKSSNSKMDESLNAIPSRSGWMERSSDGYGVFVMSHSRADWRRSCVNRRKWKR